MPSGESCCVDCHTSTWPLPPPQVATARAYGMGLTCFIPGEIPGYKGFILIRENKSNAIIRSHLRGCWHQSVEYVHVNLLDFFARNSSCSWQPMNGICHRHRSLFLSFPDCPRIALGRLSLKNFPFLLSIYLSLWHPLFASSFDITGHLRQPRACYISPCPICACTWSDLLCWTEWDPSAFDSPVESGSSLHPELICRCSLGRGSAAWPPSPEREKNGSAG